MKREDLDMNELDCVRLPQHQGDHSPRHNSRQPYSHQVETANALMKQTPQLLLNTYIGRIVLVCIPNILINKLYYLALIPKDIPDSSSYVYLVAGDTLFYTWIIICILYCIAYRYIIIKYIIPFTEKKPFLKLPTKLCSAAIFLFLYGQFLFYSASLTPRLISLSWGPSIVNIVNLLTTILTSSPITAVLALAAILPLAGIILKWYKKALSPILSTRHKKNSSPLV